MPLLPELKCAWQRGSSAPTQVGGGGTAILTILSDPKESCKPQNFEPRQQRVIRHLCHMRHSSKAKIAPGRPETHSSAGSAVWLLSRNNICLEGCIRGWQNSVSVSTGLRTDCTCISVHLLQAWPSLTSPTRSRSFLWCCRWIVPYAKQFKFICLSHIPFMPRSFRCWATNRWLKSVYTQAGIENMSPKPGSAHNFTGQCNDAFFQLGKTVCL